MFYPNIKWILHLFLKNHDGLPAKLHVNGKMFHLHVLVLWFGSDFLVEAMPSPEATG